MGALGNLNAACWDAWRAGLLFRDPPQPSPDGEADPLLDHWREGEGVDRALEAVQEALTLGGVAPRRSLPEVRDYLMKWGVDEGLLGVEQYDEWKSQQ